MLISLDKLMKYAENRYVFTKAGMEAVDRVKNMDDYPESDVTWKVVPNVLKLMLDEKLQFDYSPEEQPEDRADN